jgi:hypothetical protein
MNLVALGFDQAIGVIFDNKSFNSAFFSCCKSGKLNNAELRANNGKNTNSTSACLTCNIIAALDILIAANRIEIGYS